MVNFGPLAAEIGLPARLGHPCKFQQVSFVGFVTAAMSLTRGRPNFARCLAVSWAGTLCIHFWSSCPLREFCQVQNSLCLQVLSCPILALEYWTWAKLCGVVQAEADLGMFSMFGRTGAPRKRGPQEDRQIFATWQHAGNNW